MYMAEKKQNGTVIVMYRCNSHCSICNRYKSDGDGVYGDCFA